MSANDNTSGWSHMYNYIIHTLTDPDTILIFTRYRSHTIIQW